eukprot:TRINITY_DN2451_c0_g2_i3.p1 TRINITY_DN2451_c0_g2~~TRINITY_DN2451_c0_g2_i3.p1  ORF type:complete len:542 (+),score=37.99 TRINITY_DN2451_c0_g2_i3:125-1750(+)
MEKASLQAYPGAFVPRPSRRPELEFTPSIIATAQTGAPSSALQWVQCGEGQYHSVLAEGCNKEGLRSTFSRTRLLRFTREMTPTPLPVSHDFWEEVLLLSGSITDTRLGQTYSQGHYACRPPGMKHGPYTIGSGDQECTMLVVERADDTEEAKMQPSIAHRPEDITATWLRCALSDDSIESVTLSPATPGLHMGRVYRVHLGPARPEASTTSVIIKLGPDTDNGISFCQRTNALYRETYFYQHILAPLARVLGPASHCIPRPLHSICEARVPMRYTMVFPDLTPEWTPGDLGTGLSKKQATVSMIFLGRFHASTSCRVPGLMGNSEAVIPTWGRDCAAAEGMSDPDNLTRFLDQWGDFLVDGFPGIVGKCFAAIPGLLQAMEAGEYALCHGDYKADNLLFPTLSPAAVGALQDQIRVIDWQLVAWGGPLAQAADIALFLSSSVPASSRAQWIPDLIAAYCQGHSSIPGNTVTPADILHNTAYAAVWPIAFGLKFITNISPASLAEPHRAGLVAWLSSLAAFAREIGLEDAISNWTHRMPPS